MTLCQNCKIFSLFHFSSDIHSPTVAIWSPEMSYVKGPEDRGNRGSRGVGKALRSLSDYEY